MAAEQGHAPNRVYIAQDGSLHLNGAAVYTANELDISGTIGVRGGVVTNSSLGVQTIATGLTGIVAASANPVSTAASTAAGRPAFCKVGFSTASGSLEVASVKQSATLADVMLATSTAESISWLAIGF